jgi:hypothetical protein
MFIRPQAAAGFLRTLHIETYDLLDHRFAGKSRTSKTESPKGEEKANRNTRQIRDLPSSFKIQSFTFSNRN